MTEDHGSFGRIGVSEVGHAPFRLPSSAEMTALDHDTITRGTSARELMERAGRAVSDRLLAVYPAAKNVVILCGPGNNGGDGLVISKCLRDRGLNVSVIVTSASRYSAEWLEQIGGVSGFRLFGGGSSFLPSDGAEMSPITPPEINDLLKGADLVVDALLGTSQSDAPRGAISDLVRLLASCRAELSKLAVVSVDLPTGIDADTGGVFDPHVVADLTIAIQLIKRGCLQFPARAVCGEIESVDIGISGGAHVEYSLIARSNLPLLARRAADTHKGALGRLLVIGGSLAMSGAPMLSALGALRTGTGIVSRVVRSGWSTIPPLPEAMFEVLGGNASCYQLSDLNEIDEMIKRYDTCVIGPGMGTDSGTLDLFLAILDRLKSSNARLILDADALNLLAASGASLAGLASIITPHPGEAARLLGISSALVQKDRFTAARDLARKLGAVTVLKGAGTLIHDGVCGSLVAEGTPYLATPGSGDVLSGIIAGCVARCASLRDAAVLGVWLHAKAGSEAAKRRRGPILASEIAEHLGGFVGGIEGGDFRVSMLP